MSYEVHAETVDGSEAFNETFKYRYFAYKAAKMAIKSGMKVWITKV